MSVIGQTKIYARNKQTQQFMMTRIFVIARERGPILLGNAACQWLGLIAVLVENKAPVVGRFVASVTREESECGEVEAYPLPKTGDGAEMTKQSSKTLPAIEAPKKKKTRTKKAKSVANASEPLDVTLESTPSESQPSAPERTEPNGSQELNTVLSGSIPHAEPCPKMKGIGKKSVKDGPIRKADSTEIPRRKYYRPTADAKTYRMNGQGQLQCQQDPKDVTRVGSVKELPLCREKPIFHEPVGTLIKDKEQLTEMYPNSFDRIGSLKGEYTIKIDPSVAPVQQARCKVPIESKEAICAALDSMIAGDILEPQIEPTPWVNNATYPVKPTGEVRPCLDCIPLNKAIIRENHTPPTVEEIAHELAGARYFTKGDAYKAFLHVHLSKKSRELTVFGTNTHGRLRYKRMLLQLQKYDMKIEYKPGSEMLLADALSRCPARYSQEIKLDLRVDYIAFTSAWIETLKETTCEDPVLSTVYQLVQHGWPKERRRVPNVAKYYWDFRDELSTDEGLLLKGPSLIIPAALRENYLQRLHEGHLSASKTITNARQHMFWPGIEADIKDYTRRCQVCIKRSRPAREPLQPHEIPDGPWQKLGMDFFNLKGKCYILICDYFSKFPFMFSCKTSWGSLKDRLIDLFSNEGFPKEIISDNGSPFNSQEFADYLSSHGVKHTTSSPHYPQSNGFIERHIQTVKNLLYKAMDAGTRSFQEVLSELRATKIGNDLPSPAEILHGRSLITGEPVTVDHAKVKAVLVGRQIKDSQQYNKSHKVKSQRTLVLGERCWGTGTNNQWLDCYITGIDQENRCYWVVFEDTGRRLRRTRSHLRPRGPDFPHISERFLQQNAASGENSVISGREGENEANNQEILVLSGPPLNSEQDTAVDFVSDAPSERAVTFNDNPVDGTRYIPLRLRDTPQEPRPLPAELPFDPMTPAADAIPRPETAEQ